MRLVPLHDWIAGLAALMLLAAGIALAILGREIPPFLQSGFALALGYVFRGGIQAANEARHRKESANDPSAGPTRPNPAGPQ